jgi:hypothetical protein
VRHRDNASTRDEHALADSDVDAYRGYGISGNAVILVRPDGYVGLTGGSLEQEPIIDYLRHAAGRWALVSS